jgi:hypothetical protein
MTATGEFQNRFCLSIMGGILLIVSPAVASTQPPQSAIDVQKIVRDASWNELHSTGPPHFFRYRISEQTPKGSDVRLAIQTKDGAVVRVVEKWGRPLSAADNAVEVARLRNLLASPDMQRQRHKSERQESDREDELVRMLPDAFLYSNESVIQGPSGPCYRLRFKPNPAFAPPDREGEVFHGMVGELWVDQAQLRIARIDAHLVSDVNFGWGVLGKLYRGGSILEENADVGGNHWESTMLRLHLTGKILMVKSVDFSTSQISTDFRPVPLDTTYQQAIQMLLSDAGTR